MDRLVIGIGEALWDMLPEGKKLGGAPANFAFHAGQFGLESMAVSAIGLDPLGEEIAKELEEHGLPFHLDRIDYPTGTVHVTLDSNGIPRYEIKEDVALAGRAQAVCFGSLAQRNPVSRETIGWFLDAVPEDCLKVFDINLRQSFYSKEIIEDSLRRCDILKINDEELEIVKEMFGLEDLPTEGLCRSIIDEYGLKMLILTCGVNGSHVFSGDVSSFIETPKVKVADTVGAGDSFTGAFVASILKGKTVREAHEAAVKVSAFVCTQSGAMPVIPEDLK